MAKPSKSPDRHRFQDRTGSYSDREGGDDTSRHEWWEEVRRSIDALEADPSWAVDNMEHDLRTTDWILAKARASDAYAQNLYAAMCNNDFVKRDVYNVLTDKRWHCSWRHAGGIVADMRGKGDYIDWYCSGSASMEDGGYEYIGYVPEGTITDEVRGDLHRLGWSMLDG